jgi:hypothetical protein
MANKKTDKFKIKGTFSEAMQALVPKTKPKPKNAEKKPPKGK